MGPRYADALPEALPLPIREPGRGPVTDFGRLLNYTNNAEPFTHGLQGVDQSANWVFAKVLFVSFMALLVITMGYRWVQMAHAHIRHLMTMGRLEDQRYWMNNHSRFWPRVKKSLLYAPLGHQRHNRELQLSKAVSIGTLPSRFHTILLVLYLASNIAYCLVQNWSRSNSSSVVAELRGRTGMLAAVNLVPTVLFALRNNPLIPLLKVSYDTFNLLHRWCARVVIIEATIHTICWAVNSLDAGGLYQVRVTLATSTSYMWGMVATSSFGLIFLTSFSPVRHAFYETFLNVHRLLVWLALVGVYIHLDKANLPQLPYVQLCIAFWWAEWVRRTLRLCYYNVSRQRGITRITVEAIPAEACRVTFELSRPWHWKPGCHVHAYLPQFALWSSHPFSVAWAESKPRSLPLEVEMEKMASVNHSVNNHSVGRTIAGATHQPESVKFSLPHDAACTSVSLVMRARTGMTRKLYDKASAAPTSTITTWGAIEGPYGGHDSMTSYGTVLIFGGGVGITHCIGYVYHLMLQHQAGITSTQKILLVWSVPNTEALEWVRGYMDTILRMEGRRDVLRIQLFVTKPRHRGEVISNTGSVQMFPGRCNPSTIVEKEMQERIGTMGVTVCGPGAFADSVRAAVRNVVTEGAVDFVEEAFTY